MSDHIPPDLITVILSRLSVKTLLRFRSVSKQWRLLIDNKEFHKSHMNWSIENSSNSYIIANDKQLWVYSMDFDALDKAHKINNLSGRWSVIDSCNGIVLLWGGELKGDDKIALFNPATRSHYFLPGDNAPFFTGFYIRSYKESFAFGYDLVGNDFKVVSILKLGSVYKTMIFSLKTKSWKQIHDFPYKLHRNILWGVHVNGALHAVVNQRADHEWSKSIVALDLAQENYQLMTLPNSSTKGVKIFLDKLGQCLCLFACTKIKVDVWVMKEYGVARSWTMLLSVEPPALRIFDVPLKTLGYSKDGEKVLMHYPSRKFTWHDLQTKQFKNVDMSNSDLIDYINAGVCIESLFQLDRPEETNERKEERDDGPFKLKQVEA